MFLWLCTGMLFFCSLQSIRPYWNEIQAAFGLDTQHKTLLQVETVLRTFEDTLMAGLVPHPSQWQILSTLETPWGNLTTDSLSALRSSGCALLPTLKRLRELAAEHRITLIEARVQASQTFAQILFCTFLVPLLGALLYQLLPELAQVTLRWCLFCAFACLFSGMGTFWLIHLANIARWGGLEAKHRDWILKAQCAGEKFLSLIRTGIPPDIAWTQTCHFLSQHHADSLASLWGYSLWDQTPSFTHPSSLRIFSTVGYSMKKVIQVSLLEGQPCLEKMESALDAFRQELKAQVKKELALLSTRALKPLFICVAPALFSLLGYALWLATHEIFEKNGPF